MTTGETISPTRLVALVAASAAMAAAVLAAGASTLPPPGTNPTTWPRRWEGAGPLVALFSVLRCLVVAGAGALGAAGVILLLAGRWGRHRTRLALSLRTGRAAWLARLALGVASAAPVGACATTGETAPAAPLLAADPPPTTAAPPPSAHRSPPAVALRPPTSPPAPSPVRRSGAPVTTSHPRPRRPPAGTWTVRPGDDLWSIAEVVVAGRGPGAVGPYWRRLIAANRDRLADRDDPSLIFPGQVLVLPPA